MVIFSVVVDALIVVAIVVDASTSLHTFPLQRHLLLDVVVLNFVAVVVAGVTVVVEIDVVVVLVELDEDLVVVVSVFC